MANPVLPRVLIIDDEEPILETMSFTFMDTYEVLTSTDALSALELLDANAPVAVVITDQRMPNMSGVELLAEVYKRHPETVRIMLTGFADADATIQAINDGHVYAYVSKPWEPEEFKQIVRRAVEFHELSMENTRLVEDLRRANLILKGVMDTLDTGAIAVDRAGIVRAANRPALEYLEIRDDAERSAISDLLKSHGLDAIESAIATLVEGSEGSFEDLDVAAGESVRRLRIQVRTLRQDGDALGHVVLLREVSHEPLRRRFDEIVTDVAQSESDLRPRLEHALVEMSALTEDLAKSGISSPSLAELGEHASRTQTAIQNWLDVDDAMAHEDYPDAQLLLDRMRVATQRWPHQDALPERVLELARHVEAYYESGENSKRRVL